MTGDVVTCALVSFESISYERVSFLTSYRASTDTNSCLARRLKGSRSIQPVTMDQRPKKSNSQNPFNYIFRQNNTC
jgi:hypothetical protein